MAATLQERLDALAQYRDNDLRSGPTIAAPQDILSSLNALPQTLPEEGLGTSAALEFVETFVLKGLAPGHAGPR